MSGICPGYGSTLHSYGRFDNCKRFAEAVEEYRLRELSNPTRMDAIRQGLASVVPLQLLRILTVRDLDLRVCGLPDVNLDYLKVHFDPVPVKFDIAWYGTESHYVPSWTDGNRSTCAVLLECIRELHTGNSLVCSNLVSSFHFNQDELRKFIKFACNQERIPFGHPCREDAAKHVPPFPMKIAPPDGKGTSMATTEWFLHPRCPPPPPSGPPDSRYIRAETCLFMIKLPQYSSQEIMTQKLHYAIYCREDPLSG